MKASLLLLVLCEFTATQSAYAACSEPQPRLVCAEYSASKVVVEATLLRIENVVDKDDPQGVIGRYYTLKPERILRGSPDGTIRVYEGNDSGRASFDWKVGTRYLLFLFDSIEKSTEKVLSLDGCGNSRPAARAASVIEKIHQIDSRRRTGLIAGMVSVSNLSGTLAGIQVVARGGGQVYTVSTDRKGRFEFDVPPGEYTVEPNDPPLTFRVFEMSYEDPRHLVVQPGSCAQVQFVEAAGP